MKTLWRSINTDCFIFAIYGSNAEWQREENTRKTETLCTDIDWMMLCCWPLPCTRLHQQYANVKRSKTDQYTKIKCQCDIISNDVLFVCRVNYCKQKPMPRGLLKRQFMFCAHYTYAIDIETVSFALLLWIKQSLMLWIKQFRRVTNSTNHLQSNNLQFFFGFSKHFLFSLK